MFGFKKDKKTKKKILIVEDDALLSKVLVESLSSEGSLEVVTVDNGLDALEVIAKFNPDLILLDLILPGLDGFEVLKRIKADNKIKNIPVFVLSNLDNAPDVKSVQVLGAENYFIKANTQLNDIVKAIKKRVKV